MTVRCDRGHIGGIFLRGGAAQQGKQGPLKPQFRPTRNVPHSLRDATNTISA